MPEVPVESSEVRLTISEFERLQTLMFKPLGDAEKLITAAGRLAGVSGFQPEGALQRVAGHFLDNLQERWAPKIADLGEKSVDWVLAKYHEFQASQAKRRAAPQRPGRGAAVESADPPVLVES